MKNKLIDYIDYDHLKSKSEWVSSMVPNNLRDKLVMDKKLFFDLLLIEATAAAKELEKDTFEINIIDMANYLFDEDNISDSVSIIRTFSKK